MPDNELPPVADEQQAAALDQVVQQPPEQGAVTFVAELPLGTDQPQPASESKSTLPASSDLAGATPSVAVTAEVPAVDSGTSVSESTAKRRLPLGKVSLWAGGLAATVALAVGIGNEAKPPVKPVNTAALSVKGPAFATVPAAAEQPGKTQPEVSLISANVTAAQTEAKPILAIRPTGKVEWGPKANAQDNSEVKPLTDLGASVGDDKRVDSNTQDGSGSEVVGDGSDDANNPPDSANDDDSHGDFGEYDDKDKNANYDTPDGLVNEEDPALQEQIDWEKTHPAGGASTADQGPDATHTMQ